MSVGVIAIGRNEGERLKACLRSLEGVRPVVYVDSGSTDGSVEFARGTGAIVVELMVPPNFTAARARNAGLEALLAAAPDAEFVQTIDGDCVLDPAWLALGVAALAAEPQLGAVVGRLRERHPDRSIYNALCDHEWDGPPGEAPGFGGIALLRIAALKAVDGYRPGMIAGEDTEMAMRMRKAGWRVRRLASDMALHDANITRFGQWWRRTKRGGHGYAEMAHLHPDARWPNWSRSCRSIIAWGALMPAAIVVLLLLGLFVHPILLVPAFFLLLAYPAKMAQIARAKRAEGLPPRIARALGVLLMVGKIPEFFGLARYHLNRWTRADSRLIEYKG